MSTLEKVRALFIEGQDIQCVENTYHRERGHMEYIGRVWTIEKVGKTVWQPVADKRFRGTFPDRASDVLHVDEQSATWKIGHGDHTVTYALPTLARYEIKCDDCKQTIGHTDSVRESACGGRCDTCKAAI